MGAFTDCLLRPSVKSVQSVAYPNPTSACEKSGVRPAAETKKPAKIQNHVSRVSYLVRFVIKNAASFARANGVRGRWHD